MAFLMSHAPHVWIVWIHVKARSVVEDSELIWILAKSNVVLDMFYNPSKAPRHSMQSGEMSSIHVNFTEPFQTDSATLMQLPFLFSSNFTKVTIGHQLFTMHKRCGGLR